MFTDIIKPKNTNIFYIVQKELHGLLVKFHYAASFKFSQSFVSIVSLCYIPARILLTQVLRI